MRGGEKVLEAILEIFPRAEIFTLFHFPGSVSAAIENRLIHTSGLQWIATVIPDYRWLLPLFPHAVERWDLSGFDLVVSSSHCVAKGAGAPGVPHLCYCHTPMRYFGDRFDDYFPRERPVRRIAGRLLSKRLERWDRTTSSRVDRFIANSEFIANRIDRAWGRDAEVIHPFVGDEFFIEPLTHTREDLDVVVSALVPYKRIDLAIEAARLSGRRMLILGGGPLLDALRRASPPNVELAGSVSSEMIRETLGRARSLVIPGVEDFGITALEAMACGTPVVAFGLGGVTESVIEGQTGVFFREPSAAALADALETVQRVQWNREAIRARAAEFRRQRFVRELSDLVAGWGAIKT